MTNRPEENTNQQPTGQDRPLSHQNYEGLDGTVLFCEDCQAGTVHFTAPGGVPVCGACGDTPADRDQP